MDRRFRSRLVGSFRWHGGWLKTNRLYVFSDGRAALPRRRLFRENLPREKRAADRGADIASLVACDARHRGSDALPR